MPSALWRKAGGGALVKNSGGQLVRCATCPCTPFDPCAACCAFATLNVRLITTVQLATRAAGVVCTQTGDETFTITRTLTEDGCLYGVDETHDLGIDDLTSDWTFHDPDFGDNSSIMFCNPSIAPDTPRHCGFGPVALFRSVSTGRELSFTSGTYYFGYNDLGDPYVPLYIDVPNVAAPATGFDLSTLYQDPDTGLWDAIPWCPGVDLTDIDTSNSYITAELLIWE